MDAFANMTACWVRSSSHVEVQGPVYRNPPRSLHRQGGRGQGISRLIKEGETAAYETLGLKTMQLTGSFNGGLPSAQDALYSLRGYAVTSMLITGLNGPVAGTSATSAAPTCASTSIPIWRNNSGGKSRSIGSTSAMPRLLSRAETAAYD